MVEMTDEDFRRAVQNVLPRATDGAFWFFGYGSLLWNPACEVVESREAIVHGWHRAFCIRIYPFCICSALVPLRYREVILNFSRATECFARESQTVGLAMIERGRPRSLATRRHAPSHRRPAS